MMRLDQEVIVERRHEDGTLDLKGEQPPCVTCKFEDLFHKMFWRDPENKDKEGTLENLTAWLKKKGWSYRAKTW